MRQLVARVLHQQGFSQSRISSMLGITQASVSIYFSSPAPKAYASLASLSLSREDADRYASLLAEDVKRSPVYGVDTLTSIWTSLLGKGLVCEAHRRLYPSLSECDVCIKEYGQRHDDRSGALAHVSEAVRIIESAREFVSVMPEVSVNVAYLAGDSATTKDVVAVPGRIVKVRNSAKALLQPEFGASGHMARMLLLVRQRRKDVRAAINLRYDERMARVLRRMGLKCLEIGGYAPSGREDPTVEALASVMLKERKAFDAVVDSGGKGTEPDVYMFGRDAVEVARLAVKAAKLYSAH
jgi:predicted fused transcriptional regulator/phosphomethylpyrimidine kinase/predicted transcriptional regulator